GHILVDSIPGQGASFRLLFPIVDVNENINDAEIIRPVSDDSKVVSAKHILVVDDDILLAEFEKEILLDQGYQVTMKTDSQEALELFKNNPQQFDLVLTDQTMPGITGVELAQEIMKIKPETPVILCTGYSEYMDEERAVKMGIYAYLNKPVNVHELLETINRIPK
ncbi:MAG: response regulator, partial [Gammaproteobacteria bacterium]|nr:response regulator [Gammaproteobacteria bacterium]